MATNKIRQSKKKHSKKNGILKHDTTKKGYRNRSRRNRSRRNRSNVSSWKNYYTYESSVSSNTTSNKPNTNNKGNIVDGLRDFLALKK
jgi:hypothetical protein